LFIFGPPQILDFFLKTIYERRRRCTLHPLDHRTTWTAEEMHALIDRGDAGKIRKARERLEQAAGPEVSGPAEQS
jgi:hypothetical protein